MISSEICKGGNLIINDKCMLCIDLKICSLLLFFKKLLLCSCEDKTHTCVMTSKTQHGRYFQSN